MNWDAVGAIGEIVGAAVVAVTLLFLIRQLNQHTTALQQQSERESASAFQQWSLATMEPDTARAVGRAWIKVEEDLTPEEMVSIEHFVLSFLFVLQQDYLDWTRGLQSDDVWTSRVGLIDAVFTPVMVRKWWKQRGHSYVIPEFRIVIESHISDSSDKQQDYWNAFKAPPNKTIETDA